MHLDQIILVLDTIAAGYAIGALCGFKRATVDRFKKNETGSRNQYDLLRGFDEDLRKKLEQQPKQIIREIATPAFVPKRRPGRHTMQPFEDHENKRVFKCEHCQCVADAFDGVDPNQYHLGGCPSNERWTVSSAGANICE